MSAEKPRDPRGADQEFTIGSPLPHDPDAPPVGPTFAGPFAMGGGVEGVNDAGSEPIDVRITRYEAEVLYRHWFARMRDAYEFCFVYEASGSEEWRESLYASYRRGVLAPHVSVALLDELREEARRRDATLDANREAYRRFLEADSKVNRPALDADEEGDEFADAGDRE